MSLSLRVVDNEKRLTYRKLEFDLTPNAQKHSTEPQFKKLTTSTVEAEQTELVSVTKQKVQFVGTEKVALTSMFQKIYQWKHRILDKLLYQNFLVTHVHVGVILCL